MTLKNIIMYVSQLADRMLYICQTKIKRFWKVRQSENDARSLAIFVNIAIISNTSDNQIWINAFMFLSPQMQLKSSAVHKL